MSQSTAPQSAPPAEVFDPNEKVDVRAVINSVLDDTDLTSTADIIDVVMGRISPHAYAEALREALVEVVRAQIGRHNVGPIKPTSPAAPGAPGARLSWKAVQRYDVERLDMLPADILEEVLTS
jgi:hypothetical protein